jgi:hypothetical protein
MLVAKKGDQGSVGVLRVHSQSECCSNCCSDLRLISQGREVDEPRSVLKSGGSRSRNGQRNRRLANPTGANDSQEPAFIYPIHQLVHRPALPDNSGYRDRKIMLARVRMGVLVITG